MLERLARILVAAMPGLPLLAVAATPTPPTTTAVMATNPLYQARSDWGCECLLCLSDPRGPKTESACRPPIDRLWSALARGHPFPTCTLSNGQDSRAAGAYAVQGWNYYDPCPAGTAPLAAGLYARPTSRIMPVGWNTPTVLGGIGDGSTVNPGWYRANVLPPLVCVGRLLGTEVVAIRTGDQINPTRNIPVGRYDRVVTQSRAASPNFIDVYIDNQLARRVRW